MRSGRNSGALAAKIIPVVAALALATCGTSMAVVPDRAADDQLHLDVDLGFWATWISGTTKIGPVETDVNATFDDIIHRANFAAMGGIEFVKSNWVVDLNGVYCHLSDSATGPLGRDIDVKGSIGIAELAVGYDLVRTKIGGMPLTLTPMIGGRYTNISETIEIGSLPSIDKDRQWVDPYIGGRIMLGLSDNLAWRTEGSIGGTNFVSDTIWGAATYLDWEFARNFVLNVGYRAMSWDYDQNNFKWEMTFYGPWLGLTWRAF